MKTLALDLGTKCGWAFGAKPRQSGVWKLQPSRFNSAATRFTKFRDLLRDAIEGNEITKIVFEEVHRHFGTDAAHIYGGLVAVMQLVCIDYGIVFQGVSVQAIKKHATGNANAKKEAIIEMASLIFADVNILDDNHADAIWLWDYSNQGLNTNLTPKR